MKGQVKRNEKILFRGNIWIMALVVALLVNPLLSLADSQTLMVSQTLRVSAQPEQVVPEAEVGIAADWWATVQEDLQQAEYNVTWQEQTYLADIPAAYQAPNRAHNLRTYFVPAGPIVIPRTWPEETRTPPWRWEVSLTGWGREGIVEAVPQATLEARDNSIEYRRGASESEGGLVEWYRNGEEGLEQHFRLAVPPAGGDPNAPLQLVLTLGGSLTPQSAADTGVRFNDASGQAVLSYGSLSALDATGRPLPVWLSPADSAFSLSVDDTGAAYPIEVGATISGLPSTANWAVTWGAANTLFGYSVATAGDVDHNGYSDVIVGARDFDGGQTDEGKAFLFFADSLGLSTSYNWSKEGNQADAHLGWSVATAGDVDADGYSDIIIGAPEYDHPEGQEGGAWVYYGSGEGIDPDRAWFAESNQAGAQLGYSVASAGDVNLDGYADIIVGAYYYDNGQSNEGAAFVWHGSHDGVNGGVDGTPSNVDWRVEGNQDGALLGMSISTAGDVNGDGYADVIVGAAFYTDGTTKEGAALAWHGSENGLNNGTNGNPTNAPWMVEGNNYEAYLGQSVSTAGDVNGDGYSDVIVGAPQYSNGQEDEGAAYLYLGSEDGLLDTWDNEDESNKAGAWFGYSVATAGDVNGDGYADVVVGAPLYTNDQTEEGRAWVWFGSPDGISALNDWWAEGNAANAWYGDAVATAGDVNGDGYSDLIVGAPGDASQAGTAFVYYGSPGALSETAQWTERSGQELAKFGWSVGTAGDVNGDGYADIIVGTPYWDDGQTDEGAAWIYCGSATGLPAHSCWYEASDQATAWFGYAVGTAGDVNGDGYDDIVVGAPLYDNPESNEGAAWVYEGSISGVSHSSSWFKDSDQAGAELGCAVGTAGDVNGDGYSDIVVGAPFTSHGQSKEGVAWLYLGSSSGLNEVPAWHGEGDDADGMFGAAVGTAGDVNGDGYSDVIVGSPLWDDDVTNEGRVWVYYGSAHGLDPSESWYVESNYTEAQLGFAVGTAGDVNGDGYSDIIVGAPYRNGSEGRVYAFYGSASGLNPTGEADWYKDSGDPGAEYGYSVGTAGDVNGDGYADIILGAPLMSGGVHREGAARVYYGSADGLGATPAWRGAGGTGFVYYGQSVGTAGDVNGDGYADILVGSPSYTADYSAEGRVLLYYGSGRPGVSLLPRQQRLDPHTAIAHLGLSDGLDGFCVRAAAWTPYGRGGTILEIEVKPLGTRFNGLNTWRFPYWQNFAPGYNYIQCGSDLAADTAYHWRARWLYRPATTPFQPYSRWFTMPWNGWDETDLRTGGTRIMLPLVLRNY
jgi:hypothetical protein